jgi:hypothetical protein
MSQFFFKLISGLNIRKLYYEGMEPGEAADDMRLALSTIYNSRRSGFGLLIALLRRGNIRVWLWAISPTS